MPLDGSTLAPDIRLLAKIDGVINLLATENRWTKQHLRSSDGRRCILGAMMAANAVVELKEPILLAIKQVTGRDYRRIETFNDYPPTTHSDVLAALYQARRNILNGIHIPVPAAPQPWSFWNSIGALFARARSCV